MSSKLWLERQLNDPYVAAARNAGWRSRSAFKLAEIDDKARFLKPGAVIVDLGAAPGGWSQVAAERVRAGEGRGRVIALDLSVMDPLPGVSVLQRDFLEPETPQALSAALGPEKADAVISDMAAGASGHRQTDHSRSWGYATPLSTLPGRSSNPAAPSCARCCAAAPNESFSTA